MLFAITSLDKPNSKELRMASARNIWPMAKTTQRAENCGWAGRFSTATAT